MPSKLLHLDTKKKAQDTDTIFAECLKRYVEWETGFLKLIFEKSLFTRNLPGDLLCATVILVFGCANKLNVGNYRPISLRCLW